MEPSVDSTPLVVLMLLVFVPAMFVAGIISSVRLVNRLENEENCKNRH